MKNPETDDFISRLDYFIRSNYPNRTEFAADIGIPLSTINQYFSASRKSRPAFPFFEAFLKRHSISDLEFIMKGYTTDSASAEVREPREAYASKSDINRLISFFESGKFKVQVTN